MEILTWSLIFMASLAFLIKSSDYFIDYAERIGLSIGMSPALIGTLILAFGTSIPELITSLIAVTTNNSEIVAGNVVGSNIANVLMVGGMLLIAAKSFEFNLKQFKIELWVLPFISLLLVWMFYDGKVDLIEASILLVLYVGFLVLTVVRSKRNKQLEEEEEPAPKAKWYYWIVVILGAAGIYFGAKYTVTSIVQLSVLLGVKKDILALSAVALGTSLPELVVSIVAARKGQMDMALGNILGSNIFNILSILSIPSFISAVTISKDLYYISLPIMIVTSLLLVLLLRIKRLNIGVGIAFVVAYMLYNIELFSGIFSGMVKRILGGMQ